MKARRINQGPTWQGWVSVRALAAAGSAAEAPIEASRVDGSIDELIAKLAYSYWEARGRQGGSPEADWLRAEQEIRQSGSHQS